MSQPTFYPEWAINSVNLPSTGQSNKSRPKESLRLTGWDPGQLLTAEEWNWQFKNIYDWIYHFNTDYFLNATSSPTPSTLMERDSYGSTNVGKSLGIKQSEDESKIDFINSSDVSQGNITFNFISSSTNITKPRSNSLQETVGNALVRYDTLTTTVQNQIYNTLVGVPIPWPTNSIPTNFLKMNGQSFNTSTYPLLAQRYPSGVLPDLRGEFIRGWDDSRGVDSGRGLLSWQNFAVENHSHSVDLVRGQLQSNADTNTNEGVWGTGSTGSYGGNETRPRNVAFCYVTLIG
jgi:hypothetical protein